MKKRLTCVFLLAAATGCLHVASDGRVERWALGRAAWSVVVPGLGQIINNEPGKGALMLGLSLVNELGVGEWVEDADGHQEWEWLSDEARARYLLVGLGLRTWSGVDAYKVAEKQNEKAPVRLGLGTPEAGSPSARGEDGQPVVLVLNPFGGQLSATLCHRF